MKFTFLIITALAFLAAKGVSGQTSPFDALSERELQGAINPPCNSDSDCDPGRKCCPGPNGNDRCFRPNSDACTSSGSGSGSGSGSDSCDSSDWSGDCNRGDCLSADSLSKCRECCEEADGIKSKRYCKNGCDDEFSSSSSTSSDDCSSDEYYSSSSHTCKTKSSSSSSDDCKSEKRRCKDKAKKCRSGCKKSCLRDKAKNKCKKYARCVDSGDSDDWLDYAEEFCD